MLLVPSPGGHIVVAQADHGDTCGQLGRAWGNELVGEVTPADTVIRAATVHDNGWLDWEQAPTLNPSSGLPHTFATAPYAVHLEIHSRWSHALAEEDPYAGLLVALHHASFFPRPGRVGRLRRGGRRIAAFRDDLDQLARDLRRGLEATDEEVERNRRLVRTWDGISHDLLVNALPRTRHGVPARDGTLALTVTGRGDGYAVDPWPFRPEVVTVRARGRLLRGTFSDTQEMRVALAAAPSVELAYELRPA